MIAFFMMLRYTKDGPFEALYLAYHHRRAAVRVRRSSEMEALTLLSRSRKTQGSQLRTVPITQHKTTTQKDEYTIRVDEN